jgi:DNA polymerase-3 subunit delta'
MNMMPPGTALALEEQLPWHQEHWQQLGKRLQTKQLPHALLLAGTTGLGKRHFAQTFAQTLLCAQPSPAGIACQVCRSCQLFRAGTHPDLHWVEPAEAGKGILVDQVREVIRFLSLTAQHSDYKVVLITPAEQMNSAAANSLLKTLEEPASFAVLLLISSRPAALPATIRSRCQALVFQPPAGTIARSWLVDRIGEQEVDLLLSLNGGAPLAALSMAVEKTLERRYTVLHALNKLRFGNADPIEVAASWTENGTADLLQWLCRWLEDLIKLNCGAPEYSLANQDLLADLKSLAMKLDTRSLFYYRDRVNKARQLTLGSANLNAQLLLEHILITWMKLGKEPLDFFE